MSANRKIISFEPHWIDAIRIERGFTYGFFVSFFDTNSGASIDISNDTFEMPVKNSDGDVVDTLEIGSGLSFGPTDNRLNIQIPTTITAEAGNYSYYIIWQRAGSSDNFPAIAGQIVVVNVL